MDCDENFNEKETEIPKTSDDSDETIKDENIEETPDTQNVNSVEVLTDTNIQCEEAVESGESAEISVEVEESDSGNSKKTDTEILSKEKDSDSFEATNDECELSVAQLVETVICNQLMEDKNMPEKVDEVLAESNGLGEIDLYAMRKESLKNAYWDDSEDESDDPDPDLEIPQNKILWAAEKNEIEAVRQLLDDDPALVNSRDDDGYTPLHRASYNNHVEVIKLLLSYNANMSGKTEDQWEPLHCACKWDSVEAASLLIQNGANVNATTKGGLTPLHLAASNTGGRRTLELLLWHPYIDPTIKSERGDTAYDVACQSSPHYKLFEMIDISINCY